MAFLDKTITNADISARMNRSTSSTSEVLNSYNIPGGALGYFWGGYVPPGTPNWHPVLKKISPKIDTPFYKWANFLYSVLESL